MAKTSIREPRNLPLHWVLGAPLAAIVRAEAEAARATLEFVEGVGFDAGREPARQRLRMTRYVYQKEDEKGDLADFEVVVPVLSLVPIPLVGIKRATFDLQVDVDDVGARASRAFGDDKEQTTAEMRVTIADRPGDAGPPGDIAIHIEVEKADVPSGVAKILRTFEAAIQERRREPESRGRRRPANRGHR